jgi:predicted HicB family RNase H-like nuclease
MKLIKCGLMEGMNKAMSMSKAQIKANKKYNLKAYDRIEIQVKKGSKDMIEAAAKLNNESTNTYIKKAVNVRVKADTGNEIEL